MKLKCDGKFTVKKGLVFTLKLSENNLPSLKEKPIKVGDEVEIEDKNYEILEIERFHVFLQGYSDDSIGILVKEKSNE